MEVGPVFGLNIGDLLEIYDPDLQSWKMSGCLFTGDYGKSSGPLPKSGIMRSGKIYGQVTWVRRIYEKDFLLLPTPKAQDGGAIVGRMKIKNLKNVKTFGGTINTPRYYLLMKHNIKFTPMMSEYLMGYPEKWTDLKELGMQLFLK